MANKMMAKNKKSFSLSTTMAKMMAYVFLSASSAVPGVLCLSASVPLATEVEEPADFHASTVPLSTVAEVPADFYASTSPIDFYASTVAFATETEPVAADSFPLSTSPQAQHPADFSASASAIYYAPTPTVDLLSELPSSVYPAFPSGKAAGEQDPSDCSVCMDNYDIGDDVVRLPCGHVGGMVGVTDEDYEEFRASAVVTRRNRTSVGLAVMKTNENATEDRG